MAAALEEIMNTESPFHDGDENSEAPDDGAADDAEEEDGHSDNEEKAVEPKAGESGDGDGNGVEAEANGIQKSLQDILGGFEIDPQV